MPKATYIDLEKALANSAVVGVLSKVFDGSTPPDWMIEQALETVPLKERVATHKFIERVIELRTSKKAKRAHAKQVREELSWNRDPDKAYRVKLFRDANPEEFARLEGQKAPSKKDIYLKRR